MSDSQIIKEAACGTGSGLVGRTLLLFTMYLLQLYCTIKDQNSINDTHLDLLVFCNVLMIFGMKSREIRTIAEEKVGACVKDRIILK